MAILALGTSVGTGPAGVLAPVSEISYLSGCEHYSGLE